MPHPCPHHCPSGRGAIWPVVVIVVVTLAVPAWAADAIGIIAATLIGGAALMAATLGVLALVPRRPRGSLWRQVDVPARPAVTWTATAQVQPARARVSWPHLAPPAPIVLGQVVERKEIGG
jgi:hypothetical protein